MKETAEIIFGLLGGLALFIYGMNMMSECLQKAAGERMKQILALLTKNPFLGVTAGALTTAVLQSSSATTVMAIGFVSAGLMTLPQSISIILGANVGTTITAQIIAFKISDYIDLFIFAGFFLAFISRREKVKNVGQTIFAFGLLFLGIDIMGSVMKPLAGSAFFTNLMEQVAEAPVLGLLLGTVMTFVVQSSSATIAVLQNVASQPGADGISSVLGLTGALPILLGDNIGTTITAFLAAIGQSKDAKRTALAHSIFNISGAFLFLWFIKPYGALIQYLSPKGNETDVIARQIANAHTGFNLTMTILWLLMLPVLVMLVVKIIPDGKNDQGSHVPVFLDERLLGQPAAALQLVKREAAYGGTLVEDMLLLVQEALEQKGQIGKKCKKKVRQKALQEQALHLQIHNYLAVMFSEGVMTEEQAEEAADLLRRLDEVHHIADRCQDMTEQLWAEKKHKQPLSEEACKDARKSLKNLQEMYEMIQAGVSKGS